MPKSAGNFYLPCGLPSYIHAGNADLNATSTATGACAGRPSVVQASVGAADLYGTYAASISSKDGRPEVVYLIG